MQIAKVVPKVTTRGDGVFDYAIPPEILADIKNGVLVLVPFRGKKTEGIVVDIKRYSKIDKLKSIISVVDKKPVIDEVHIKLSQWMSSYYLEPFSKCLFENIVPPAKRILNKRDNLKLTKISESTLKYKRRKFLIMADFKERLTFYLRAIKKTINNKQAVIILVPDLSVVPYFTNFFHDRVSVLHSGLSHTERWLEWDKIRNNEIDIVIGSNSALFAPVHNLGLIIIDQEENESFKNYQSPRFHALNVANKLSYFTNADLVIGSLTPSTETYYNAQKENYLYKGKLIKKPETSIIDMNFEKNILSHTLRENINFSLNKKQKILLVLNRKGEGSQLKCADCGWLYACSECGLPLIPLENTTYCYNCEKNFKIIRQCPKCLSHNLKSSGLTTKKLTKIISETWPSAKTINIEKPAKNNEFTIPKNWDIAVATNYALKFHLPKISLVAIINTDQGLNDPGYKATENVFQSFYKFLRLADIGFLQTHLPASKLVKDLANLSYEDFFKQEIIDRKNANFPPFTKLIRLLGRNTNEQKILQESNLLANLLFKLKNPNLNILGPSPTFIARQRGFYYQQIILKANLPLAQNLKDIINKLPKNWLVDIDYTG